MTRNAHIQAVLFDLGGVLIELDMERLIRAVARRLKVSPHEVRHRFFAGGDFYGPKGPRLLRAYECGKVSDAAFHRDVEAWLGQPLPFAAFVRLWNALFVKQIAANVRLFRALNRRGDLKVGILSNTNALHCRYLRRRMRVLGEVEHLFLSPEMKCRKPDAAAFRYALKRMGVRPHGAVFVDDTRTNVDAARKLGLHVIHATSPAAVRAGLVKLGVIEENAE